MAASSSKTPQRTEDRYKETLLNILPAYIADELVRKKAVHPKVYRHTTILFTDVVRFSRLAHHLDPVTLIRKLNSYVTLHDRIMDEFGIEKIKTIGDTYMGDGVPCDPNPCGPPTGAWRRHGSSGGPISRSMAHWPADRSGARWRR